MHQKIKDFQIIGVDIEYYTFNRTRGAICLIQLSDGHIDFVIDMLAIGDYAAAILSEIFMNPKVLKIFHGGMSDIQWLKFGYGIYCQNVFDTSIAYKVLKDQTQLPSLAFLLKHFMDITMDKMF